MEPLDQSPQVAPTELDSRNHPRGAPRLCDRGEEEHDQRPLVVNHRDQAAATYGQLLRKRQAGRALVSMFG
jgi:hypothetical protein